MSFRAEGALECGGMTPLSDFGMSKAASCRRTPKAAGKGWLKIPGRFLLPAAQNGPCAAWR
jgi:hypothetical protein